MGGGIWGAPINVGGTWGAPGTDKDGVWPRYSFDSISTTNATPTF
jgi:hypothetical protein